MRKLTIATMLPEHEFLEQFTVACSPERAIDRVKLVRVVSVQYSNAMCARTPTKDTAQ